jgi:hypothetical protein
MVTKTPKPKQTSGSMIFWKRSRRLARLWSTHSLHKASGGLFTDAWESMARQEWAISPPGSVCEVNLGKWLLAYRWRKKVYGRTVRKVHLKGGIKETKNMVLDGVGVTREGGWYQTFVCLPSQDTAKTIIRNRFICKVLHIYSCFVT